MRKILPLLLVFIFVAIGFGYANSEKIIFSVADSSLVNYELYMMNPDGSNIRKLFDFKNHPKAKFGSVRDLRISRDGKTIFFSSDNAFAYTPLSENIFRIASDGSWIDQITPSENSGIWNAPCPCGIVKGIVKKPGTNLPYGGCPVFLEGKGMVYSTPDGSFLFRDVPSGVRFIVAYRPGSRIYDAKAINVIPNGVLNIVLVPNSDYRTGITKPIPIGDRVYFKFGQNKIQWTDLNASSYHDIYKATGMCEEFPDIDGFDVDPITGRIAIMDYQTGCKTNRGLYITDQNGKNFTLFVDLKADNSFSDAGEVFWSPDGKMLAVKVSYNYITYFALIDAKTGKFISSVPFAKDYTMYNVNLYGFSPSGDKLLFSYGSTQTNTWFLSKINITPNGTLDMKSVKNLLKNIIIISATWGRLSSPSPLPRGGVKIK